MPHLPPHIAHFIYAVVLFAAGVFAGKWLEKQGDGQKPRAGFCPLCGAKIKRAEDG